MDMGGKKRPVRVGKLLQDLGLEDKEDNKSSEPPGGQQQCVSIARVLMNGGEIIFVDELAGTLDTASGENVIETTQKLHKKGHTVIMVTYDSGIAAAINRTIEIRDGEIISDISKNPEIPESGIERIKGQTSWLFYYDQFMGAFKMSVQVTIVYKVYSFLAMFGIIIDTASAVSVVALGNGSQKKILESISVIDTSTISISPGNGFGDRCSGKIKTLTIADAKVTIRQNYAVSTAL